MHAVVIRVSINDREAANAYLQETVVPSASQAPGFVAGYWTQGQNPDGMSMVVWESEEAAQGFKQSLDQGGSGTEAVTLDSVEVREVVASA